MCTRESRSHGGAAKSNGIYVHVGEMTIASVHCLVGCREYQPQRGMRVGGGQRGEELEGTGRAGEAPSMSRASNTKAEMYVNSRQLIPEHFEDEGLLNNADHKVI